jgi:hypothetical protein
MNQNPLLKQASFPPCLRLKHTIMAEASFKANLAHTTPIVLTAHNYVLQFLEQQIAQPRTHYPSHSVLEVFENTFLFMKAVSINIRLLLRVSAGHLQDRRSISGKPCASKPMEQSYDYSINM